MTKLFAMQVCVHLTIFTLFLSSASSNKKIESLLKKVKDLPDMSQRKVASIVGAIVADAASAPFQWIYDQKVKIFCYTRNLFNFSRFSDIVKTL